MFGQGFDSPQLHHATEVGSSAGFRSFLRGDAVGSAPLLLAFVKQTGCTLARHDTPVSWRPPTWALAVRQLPSAPPKETKIESVGFGFFFCRPGSLIARKKMIAFRKNSNARGSENASNKSRLMLHSSLRFIFAQAKAPVVSTISPCRLFDGAFCFFAI